MDEGEYISERVDSLRHHSREIYQIAEGVSNDFNSWSALKLILHSAAVNMYTKVHRSQGTGDIFYIDALSGSGVSTYDSDSCFLGSPLLAARATVMPFSKMYFIDSNEDYCNALEERLEYTFSLQEFTKPKDYEIIHGDSNSAIESIVSEVRKIGSYEDNFNYFCFIDNQGMDVEWKTIKNLTPKPYGDLLINLPIAHAIGRNIDTKSINKFYGIDVRETHPGPISRDYLKNLYCKRLAERNRSVQESTQVQTPIGSFYYDLLYATRKIEGGNGYVDVIRYVKNFIESVNSGDVDRILDVLDGEQAAIKSFLPSYSVGEELNECEGSSDQTGLEDFF